MSLQTTKKIGQTLLATLLVAGILTSTAGCDSRANVVGPEISQDNPGGAEYPEDTYPTDDGFGSNDYNELPQPQDVLDTPDPLPAPSNMIQAGGPVIARAVAKTSVLGFQGLSGTYVTIEVTWQPVNGATEYWIYRDRLPLKSEATRENAYAVVKAGGLLSGFRDGLQPPSFAAGNIWEKIKRGVGAISLRPGREYKYKVIAANADGNVLGESDAASTIPLPPVAKPAAMKVQDSHKVDPVFEWEATGGVEPDGYFVSVYPSIYTSNKQLPTTAFAHWSTFRNKNVRAVRYGARSDNATAYPGSLPFDLRYKLTLNRRYALSITSVKTDTGNMKTAKAITKAWGGFKTFTLGQNGGIYNPPANNGTNGVISNPNNPQQPQQPVEEKKSTWEKIKGIFS